MDGLQNNGKPYEQMDDLGGFPPIFGSTPIWRNHRPSSPPLNNPTPQRLQTARGEIAGVGKTRRVAKLWRPGVETKPDSKGEQNATMVVYQLIWLIVTNINTYKIYICAYYIIYIYNAYITI